MPKDKCIRCGKLCLGRFCYEHLGEALDASRVLYNTDPSTWKKQVETANNPTTLPPVRVWLET